MDNETFWGFIVVGVLCALVIFISMFEKGGRPWNS